MTKMSDNDSPSLLFSEQGSTPTTPATGKWRLYTKSDGLYVVDDAGTPTGPFGASSYAGPVWSTGTSMPGSPTTNDRVTRTDLGLDFYYDGTRWLSTTLYREPFSTGDTVEPPAGPPSPAAIGRLSTWSTDFDLWLVAFYCTTYVVTTNDGSNYWTLSVYKEAVTGAGTSIATFATSADTVNNDVVHKVSIGALLVNGTYFGYNVVWSGKTGSPGVGYINGPALTYRLVGV